MFTKMLRKMAAILVVITGVSTMTAKTAEAAKSVRFGPFKLVMYGGPKAEIDEVEVRVWFDYSWYIKTVGEKIAKGRGTAFDVRLKSDGSFKETHGDGPLRIISKGKLSGNKVNITVDVLVRFKGRKKDFRLFEAEVTVGG